MLYVLHFVHPAVREATLRTYTAIGSRNMISQDARERGRTLEKGKKADVTAATLTMRDLK